MTKLEEFEEDIRSLARQYWGEDVEVNYLQLSTKVVFDIIAKNIGYEQES